MISQNKMEKISASKFYKIVTENDIDNAVAYFVQNPEELQDKNKGTKFNFLAKNGKHYPPKQTLRQAAKLKNLEIDENGFTGGKANKPFEDLGYKIIFKNESPSLIDLATKLKSESEKLSVFNLVLVAHILKNDLQISTKNAIDKVKEIRDKLEMNEKGANINGRIAQDCLYFPIEKFIPKMNDFAREVRNKTLISLYQKNLIINPHKKSDIEKVNDLLNTYVFNNQDKFKFDSKMRNLKSEFANWLIKNPKIEYFNNDKLRIEEVLDEYNTYFDLDIYQCSKENYKNIQQIILNRLYKETSNEFLTFSLKDSNHRPRAILGKRNYLKFLNEVFKDSQQEKSYNQSDITKNSHPLNTILYGPPGTGKTYKTKELAVNLVLGEEVRTRDEILEKYDELQKKKQITFTTFHQSISYEDFIEGIKPVTVKDNVIYEVKDGIFKSVCVEANKLDEKVVKIEGSETELSPEIFKELYNNLVNQLPDSNNSTSDFKLKTIKGSVFELFRNSLNSIVVKAGPKKTALSISLSELSKVYFENKAPYYSSYMPVVIDKILEDVDVETLPFDNSNKAFVLIIDEINRGNISSIFGELITLLEEDKRKGNKEEIEVILPYSKDKFSVPKNLYIIGTMNTADRSVEALDTALRRRFSFTEIQYNPDVIEFEHPTNGIVTFEDEEIDLITLLNTINERIEILIDKDHKIGHSYFLNVTSFEDLSKVFTNKVIPLLEEYFFGDFGKIGLVLGSAFIIPVENGNKVKFATNFKYDDKEMLREKSIYEFTDSTVWNVDSFLSIYSEN